MTLFVRLWRRIRSMPRRDILLASVVAVGCILTQGIMAISLNFWLYHFTLQTNPPLNPGYASCVIPAMLWAVMNFVPAVLYFSWTGEPWRAAFKNPKRTIMLLLAIGTVDALGGLTAVYAIPHVSTFIQFVLFSFGCVITFFLTKLFLPSMALPCSVPVAVTFVLVAVGASVAAIPQLPSLYEQPTNIAWLFIFVLSVILPNLYGVLLARFMDQYGFATHVSSSPNAPQPSLDDKAPVEESKKSEKQLSSFGVKLIMLSGDAITQAFVTVIFFPVDDLPWFGENPGDFSESWRQLKLSVDCILHCPDNATYMMLYVDGFWASHYFAAYMNAYSPTLGAFVFQISTPLLILLLILKPSWAVFGNTTTWEYAVPCLVCLLVAAVMFFVITESARQSYEDKDGVVYLMPASFNRYSYSQEARTSLLPS